MKNQIYAKQFDPVGAETVGMKLVATRENNGTAVWKITNGDTIELVKWFPVIGDLTKQDEWNLKFQAMHNSAIEKAVDDVRVHEKTL